MNTDASTMEAELQAYLWKILPIYAYIGLIVESCGSVVQCSVPMIDPNRNHLGGMHAAVQWAVAEMLGGVAYYAHKAELGECWAVVRDVSISFLKPAMTDIRARASFGEAEVAQIKAQLDAAGKAEFVLDIELLDATNTLVTTGRGKYYLRRNGLAPVKQAE